MFDGIGLEELFDKLDKTLDTTFGDQLDAIPVQHAIRKVFSSGLEQTFIPLTDKVGAKLYSARGRYPLSYFLWDEEEQEYAHNRMVNIYNDQSAAAFHGLGPAVGEFINTTYRGEAIFGYFTEIAVVAANIRDTDPRWNNTNPYDHADIMERKLGEIGLDIADMHLWNFGFIGDRMVAIDFG